MNGDDRIFTLKSKMSTLEWDLNIIKNDSMKKSKTEELEQIKFELNKLLKIAN